MRAWLQQPRLQLMTEIKRKFRLMKMKKICIQSRISASNKTSKFAAFLRCFAHLLLTGAVHLSHSEDRMFKVLQKLQAFASSPAEYYSYTLVALLTGAV